jgi:hypothetical protein
VVEEAAGTRTMFEERRYKLHAWHLLMSSFTVHESVVPRQPLVLAGRGRLQAGLCILPLADCAEVPARRVGSG